MNRQITIITVAAVLGLGLLLAGWWMLKGVPQSVSTSKRADETANDIVGATPSTTPADQGTQKPRQEDRSKSILQAIEGTNVPINFWGKIIDQNGRPIADVKVNYSYSTEHGSITGAAWAQQEIHKGETNTSEACTFAVTNLAGHNLTIEFLTREGYEYRPKGAMVYDFYGSSAEGRFTLT